jgi:hypothetical protein
MAIFAFERTELITKRGSSPAAADAVRAHDAAARTRDA